MKSINELLNKENTKIEILTKENKKLSDEIVEQKDTIDKLNNDLLKNKKKFGGKRQYKY